MTGITRVEQQYKQQDDAILNQSNPVDGQKYTVLDTTKEVAIIGLEVHCVWTVQPSPLEIHLTIDGVAYNFSQLNPVSNQKYYLSLNMVFAQNAQGMGTSDYTPYRPFMIEGKSVKVEAEITGGTVSNLSARLRYAKR